MARNDSRQLVHYGAFLCNDPYRVWPFFPLVYVHSAGSAAAGGFCGGKHTIRGHIIFEKLCRRVLRGCGHCAGLCDLLALEIFATGSMQVFAQPTNVDMSNRLICFNIQSLGEQLKPVAMLSMLEYINTAVMSNERNDPKAATWVYFDEIYLLLRDSLSANFLYTSWKRFRKYNAYATGITQNVQDCLTNDTAYAMLANSEFVVMLRQTKDIDSVVELYGLSEPQRKYLLLAQPGEGIIKMGNSLIPFNNPQPKDTKTYKLLTTKPGEME